MTLITQILLGSLVLGLCGGVHVALLAYAVQLLSRMANFPERFLGLPRALWVMGLAFALTVFAHSVQVWIWALFLLPSTALETLEEAVYFALVSYTTLGYGDITLGAGARLFAAFSAVTGLLTFGLSTAFLVAVVSNLPGFKRDQLP